MAQSFSTTIGLSANASSTGQPVDFDCGFVETVAISNGAGASVQYSTDGSTWTSVASGATASVFVPRPAAFRLRKSTSDSYPVPVSLAWVGRSEDERFPGAANSVVLLGDSITNYNGGPSPAAPTAAWDSKGFFVWANIMLGGRMKVLSQEGVAGETTAQMLARLDASVLARRPGFVIVLGGTNDVANNVSAATTIANLFEIYSRCTAAGIRVVAIPIIPRTGLSAGQLAALQTVNRWIKDFCRSTAGVILCDMGQAIMDPNSNWSPASGYLLDGTHPNSLGASVMGKALAAALTNIVPSADILNCGQDNLLTNPYFYGTGTTIATGWSLQGGTGATFSYVPRTDNVRGSWMQAAVANGGVANVTQNVSIGSSMAVGDTVHMAVEVQCDTLDAAAAANTQGFHVFLQCYNGSSFTTKAYAAYWDASYVNCPFPGSAGTFTTTALTIPNGTTLVQAVLTMGGGGNYRFGRAALRVGAP